MRRQKYPPPSVIAVDVDGTLLINGQLNQELVTWCRKKKAEGFFMMLWSAAGQKHAENASEMAGLNDVFDLILSKPGYVVDDQGWSWVKYTQIVKRLD